MPSRWLSLVIVAFWLATTGWLFWKDIWPDWQPGQPPPFDYDLVEEVQKPEKMKAYWFVTRNDQTVFRATTWVQYHSDDDSFTLCADYKAFSGIPNARAVPLGPLQAKRMTSMYRISRDKQLRMLEAKIEAALQVPWLHDKTVEGSLLGEVRHDSLFTHYRLQTHDPPRLLEGDLPPVTVSHYGAVLMPLHPVNRIKGLHPGQSWRMPLVDPFRDAFAGVNLPGMTSGVRYLNARVLPESLVLPGEKAIPCLVIEYEGEDVSARTWVAEDSNLVQRQEATLDDVRWVIQRDPLHVR
jgi:hypothetical protein